MDKILTFNSPRRTAKALQTLKGYLQGIKSDGVICDQEGRGLRDWVEENNNLSANVEFRELLELIKEKINNKRLSQNDITEINFICNNLTVSYDFFDQLTKDTQFLHGLLNGIGSDKKINKQELEALNDYLLKNIHLKDSPFYEKISNLCSSSLSDPNFLKKNEEIILLFYTELSKLKKGSLSIPFNEIQKPFDEITGECPTIEFEGRNFVRTGKSLNYSEADFQEVIIKYGGIFQKDLTKKTNYLIVMQEGNQAWSFSSFGRKIQKAHDHNKKGADIKIIQEVDFISFIKSRDVA